MLINFVDSMICSQSIRSINIQNIYEKRDLIIKINFVVINEVKDQCLLIGIFELELYEERKKIRKK